LGIREDSTSLPIRVDSTAYDSVRRKDLYNILIEFDIHMEIIRLIKM
jgi:hypothetical protein